MSAGLTRRPVALALGLVVAVTSGGTLLACIFDDGGDFRGGGRRTETPPIVEPNAEDESCIKGGCIQICGNSLGTVVQTENCRCSGGKCRQTCGLGSTCTCSGGNCEQACAPSAKCTCSGGGCRQECGGDAGICTCTGENCACSGPGCL